MVEHLINFNEDKMSQKVVQVLFEGQPFMGFGDVFKSAHNIILEQLLTDLGASFKQTASERIDGLGPAVEGQNYKLVGAGQAVKAVDFYLLHGDSTFYGMPINKNHVELMKDLTPYNFLTR